MQGIFDVGNYNCNRNSNGGSFNIAAGATLRIGVQSHSLQTLAHIILQLTSTVEYYGNNQTVIETTYGNLTLSSTSGTVTKTMPNTAMVIAGNFTRWLVLELVLISTAAANITVNKNVTIGASCTFNASSFNHNFKKDFVNNGTFTGSSSTVTFSGVTSNLSGTGTHNFNNLTFTASDITANANTTINVAGNLTTTTTWSIYSYLWWYSYNDWYIQIDTW
ncbi:MAG: hypothetical protein R2852_07105 [Bacteroidia bacterium]